MTSYAFLSTRHPAVREVQPVGERIIFFNFFETPEMFCFTSATSCMDINFSIALAVYSYDLELHYVKVYHRTDRTRAPLKPPRLATLPPRLETVSTGSDGSSVYFAEPNLCHKPHSLTILNVSPKLSRVSKYTTCL